MSQEGIEAMISSLSENAESATAFRSALGKTIKSLALVDDELRVGLDDGTGIRFLDDRQQCCERRYMRTDDKLDYYIGSKLTGAELKGAPDIEDGSGCHEVEFLEIQTDKGVFTLSNHNEHNGYYGGFSIHVMPLKKVQP